MSVDWGPYQCDMDISSSIGGICSSVNNSEGGVTILPEQQGPLDVCGQSTLAVDARGWRRRSHASGATPPRGWSCVSIVSCLCIVTMLLWGDVAAQLRPDTDISTQREQGVCKNVDIRNSVRTFERLNGCRVVEGYVQILLMDLMDLNEEDEAYFKSLSFPELREITGYLLLYRVQELRTLSKLFPNLAVIRGHSLFFNYALVIFEMRHLQEIGLVSLTHILRGSVRIEKNPLLCYVDTIDWDLIAQAGKGEHFITGNKRRNECPICPSGEHQCPKSPSTHEALCWNRQYCQKVCPATCGSRSCTDDGRCCDELCLGGCNGDGAGSCLVCRDVVFKNKCITRCPYGTYEYLNRRCVEEAECRNMTVVEPDGVRAKQWKPFNHTCILECPNNHVEVPIEHPNGARSFTCQRCEGSCRKECDGASVDSIASAQKLRGCTYIKGALEIQIRGGKNIVKELEESLSLIEEIEGYLKIVRSFPLISLNFLKNLTIIHGKILDNGKHAFIVRDNQNLQELWDWSTRREEFQIKRGKLFFHFNPKLCLYKIQKLQEVANLPPFTDIEVARDSNGDKVACNVTKLIAKVQTRTDSAVIIEWDPFLHHDPRALLGYVLYYIEAPSQNITLYDGRDACGGDGWMVDDVSVSEEEHNESPDFHSSQEPPPVVHIVTQLNPFTQYAYYVKTYTIATTGAGAQSPLQYFRTLPGVPSVPLALKSYSNSSSEIVIQWQPPQEPNGNITHYMVEAFWEKIDPEYLEQRDYCAEPLITLPDKKPPPPPTEDEEKRTASTSSPEDKGTCACDEKDKKSTLQKEKEIQFQIMFEDFLHNTVYVKSGQSRKKREVQVSHVSVSDQRFDMSRLSYREFPSDTTDKDGPATPQPASTNQESNMVNGKYHIYRGKVFNTAYVLKPLRHFAEYTISVSACRDTDLEETQQDYKKKACSTKSIVTSRTLKLDSADNMDELKLSMEVANQTGGEVRLKWEEPLEPNGIIVNYHIEYKRVDIENYKPWMECITRKQFLQYERAYTLKNLQPGNYSLRLRATSLAGNGAWTPVKYFLIQDSTTNGPLPVWMIIGIVVGGFVVLGMFIYLGLQRRKRLSLADMKLIASVNPEYVSTVYVPDEWEVSRKKIELINELGQGSFGMVYEGIASDLQGQAKLRCAVKTVGANASDRERVEFLNEASVMKAFKTNHVVRLLGVVSQGCPNQAALVIMELMVNGDLKSYLRSHRPNPDNNEASNMQPPTLKRILQMAIEIADGMAYLAAKKFVHRDLAARNCMVAEDLTVKIGDFGMTRDIYETDYYRKDTKGLLPVRWMAPESLKDGIFTTYSDVWSYGVVLWEMATLASQPYQGLSNDQVLRYVIEGGVMDTPENCPKKLYELMRLCWQNRPQTRPSFMELVHRLLPEVGPAFAEVSFFHNEADKEARETARIAAAARTVRTASPSIALRVSHDIEDFSLGSGSEDQESDEEVGEAAALTSHSPAKIYNSRPNILSEQQQQQVAPVVPSSTVIESPTSPPGVNLYSSDSSRGSKVSNGSTANGYITGHHNSGQNAMKTTEC